MPEYEIFSREFANLNKNRGLFLFFLGIFISIISPDLRFLLSGVILIFMSLIYLSKYFTWNLGAKGEEIVIEELKKLSTDYRIINDVRLPNMEENIDHIVIEENGIFLIETKHHKGNIKYENGAWIQEKASFKVSYSRAFKDPIKQVNRNVRKLKEFISEQKIFSEKFIPWIFTIVVFTNPEVKLQVENALTDVIKTDVIKVNELGKTIQNKKTDIKLRKNEIDELFDVLKSKSAISERKISIFKDLGESSWFKSYLNYTKFGIIFGSIYWLSTPLIPIVFPSAAPLNMVEYLPIDILYNGVISFISGKALIDLFNIKIENDFLRLLGVHFISYYMLLFFSAGLFGYEGIITNIFGHMFEINVRVVVVVLTIILHRLFNWRIPN